MTPKEKAEELVNKFRLSAIFTDSYVKAIAKTAVDEIIDSEPQYGWSNDYWKNPNDFWQEVKQEIENL